MKRLIPVISVVFLLFCFLTTYTTYAAAQQEQGVWRDTSPVYLARETSKGFMIMEFESLPADYVPPSGWAYRATLPEPELIVAYYRPVITPGEIVFGEPIFVSPLFVGSFIAFSTFYFTDFRTHWRHGWRTHPHWRHFDSRHHSQFARHKNTSLHHKLTGHPGFKGGKHSSGSDRGEHGAKGHPGIGKSDGSKGAKHDLGQKQPVSKAPSNVRGPKSATGPGPQHNLLNTPSTVRGPKSAGTPGGQHGSGNVRGPKSTTVHGPGPRGPAVKGPSPSVRGTGPARGGGAPKGGGGKPQPQPQPKKKPQQ